MNDVMKKIKCLEESGLLIIDVSETIKNEAKEQKSGFLSMLLGTLGFLMPPHPITNFEMKKYY